MPTIYTSTEFSNLPNTEAIFDIRIKSSANNKDMYIYNFIVYFN